MLSLVLCAALSATQWTGKGEVWQNRRPLQDGRSFHVNYKIRIESKDYVLVFPAGTFNRYNKMLLSTTRNHPRSVSVQGDFVSDGRVAMLVVTQMVWYKPAPDTGWRERK